MNKKNFILKYNMMENINNYVVYDVINYKGDLIYKGLIKFDRLQFLDDLMNKREFNSNQEITVFTNAFFESKKDADKYLYDWLSNNPWPVYNKITEHESKILAIICHNDGLLYLTQTEAARRYNIPQGRLSNHLRGVSGNKSIKGLHFGYKRITMDQYIELKGRG